MISINRIDTAVWEYIGKKIEDWTVIEQAIKLLRGEDKNQPDLKAIDHSIEITKASQEQLVLDLKQLDRDGYPKLKGRARQLVLNDLEESEKQLSSLMKERLKVLAGQGDWQKMQEDIDKFLKWCLTARDTYQNATYEEKRRALRVLGIVVYVYREDDKSKERYEIRVRVPDIVRHTS